MRAGLGYDVHKLVEGRDLILGGVKIPYEKGLLGHSDADVLLHAIMDALLGAAALGDIFRIPTRLIKAFPASNCWSMWEICWKNIFMWWKISTLRSLRSGRRWRRTLSRCGKTLRIRWGWTWIR